MYIPPDKPIVYPYKDDTYVLFKSVPPQAREVLVSLLTYHTLNLTPNLNERPFPYYDSSDIAGVTSEDVLDLIPKHQHQTFELLLDAYVEELNDFFSQYLNRPIPKKPNQPNYYYYTHYVYALIDTSHLLLLPTPLAEDENEYRYPF